MKDSYSHLLKNPVTGEEAPEIVDPTQYWVGN